MSYRSGDRDAFVLSGTKAGGIVYQRVVAGCPDHSIAHEVSIEDVAGISRDSIPS